MRKIISTFLFVSSVIALALAISTPVFADDDPPGRVARLNFIQGTVSFQPSGETEWVQANPNRPLTTGDNLWADRNSRGELHIDSTVIRISGETGISFLNLDDRTVQIQLAQGSLSVHVRRLDGGDAFEIDTPNLAFTVERPGEYRVDVDPRDSVTTITVREGEAEATGGGSVFHLDSGDHARISGADLLTYDESPAGPPDDFDNWGFSRDDHEEHAQSARYVSRDVIGYDDLDEYGDWRNVPDYGYVWYPSRVAAGWAPYRYGHWVWIAPWGWTWVEDEPWGFAPFHYGRWAVVGAGWCWVPGPVVVRPVYAPALVAFVGGNRFSMSLSIGGGGVAWFPLGPREVYVPTYRSSVRYVQNVNVTNTRVDVVNVTNIYNNRETSRVAYMHQNNVGAVTAVSRETFVNARPVGAASLRVNSQQLQGAEIQRGVSIAPGRQSMMGGGAQANGRPPEAVMRRQVVVKETPPATRVPFERAPQENPQLGRGQGQRPQQGQQQIAPQGAPQPQYRQRGQQQEQVPPQQQTQPVQPSQRQQPQFGQRQQQALPPQSVPSQQSVPQPTQTQQPPSQRQQPQFGQRQQQALPPQSSPPPQSVPQPAQQNPPVRYAPPAKANEDTYHPHQFEKPQNTGKPQNEAPKPSQEQPKPADRQQERTQPRDQDSRTPADNGQDRRRGR